MSYEARSVPLDSGGPFVRLPIPPASVPARLGRTGEGRTRLVIGLPGPNFIHEAIVRELLAAHPSLGCTTYDWKQAGRGWDLSLRLPGGIVRLWLDRTDLEDPSVMRRVVNREMDKLCALAS